MFDTPSLEERLARAAIEAAHEASHSFTHQYAPPSTAQGSLWAWFDEATAVFMEAAAFPDLAESRRFGLYWDYCPEVDITSWGGFGGYFAAWFVRYLGDRFGGRFLHDVWSKASSQISPIQAIETVLKSRNINFGELFWDYCCVASSTVNIDKQLSELFGRRSLTYSFLAPTGISDQIPLSPLSCRYYRILWDDLTQETTACVDLIGADRLETNELRAGIVTVGEEAPNQDLVQIRPGRLETRLRRPTTGEQLLVVGRVSPPLRPRMPPRPAICHQVALGAAIADSVYHSVEIAGLRVPMPVDMLDLTEYVFEPVADGEVRQIDCLTIAVTNPGEGEAIGSIVADYRARVTGSSSALLIQGLPVPIAIEAEGLTVDFSDGDLMWREWRVCRQMEDGSICQIGLIARKEYEAAAPLFWAIVEGAHLLSNDIRLRANNNSPQVAVSSEPWQTGYTSSIGNVGFCLPAGWVGPRSRILQAIDGKISLNVRQRAIESRHRPSNGGNEELLEIDGRAAFGAEDRLQAAREHFESAFRMATRG